MAKEYVENSMAICVFNDTKCIIMPYMIVWHRSQLGYVVIHLMYVTNPLFGFGWWHEHK